MPRRWSQVREFRSLRSACRFLRLTEVPRLVLKMDRGRFLVVPPGDRRHYEGTIGARVVRCPTGRDR